MCIVPCNKLVSDPEGVPAIGLVLWIHHGPYHDKEVTKEEEGKEGLELGAF